MSGSEAQITHEPKKKQMLFFKKVFDFNTLNMWRHVSQATPKSRDIISLSSVELWNEYSIVWLFSLKKKNQVMKTLGEMFRI